LFGDEPTVEHPLDADGISDAALQPIVDLVKVADAGTLRSVIRALGIHTLADYRVSGSCDDLGAAEIELVSYDEAPFGPLGGINVPIFNVGLSMVTSVKIVPKSSRLERCRGPSDEYVEWFKKLQAFHQAVAKMIATNGVPPVELPEFPGEFDGDADDMWCEGVRKCRDFKLRWSAIFTLAGLGTKRLLFDEVFSVCTKCCCDD
jgi:hypothetical protein